MNINSGLLEQIVEIAYGAAKEILNIYEDSDYHVRAKQDESPLTAADLASHNYIIEKLRMLDGSIPVLSEESDPVPFSERAKWRQYWLIDPLDGTKEFIAKNGEFTVNIALIEEHQPVLGVVVVPVTKQCYAGGRGLGAQRRINQEADWEPLKGRKLNHQTPIDGNPMTVVASRRHGESALTGLIDRLSTHFGDLEVKNIGSSLKICLCAEGAADLYPRFAPTQEWDTAAAQAILEAAGGAVIDATGSILSYNRKESLKNPYFFAIGDAIFDWKPFLTWDELDV